MNRLICICLVLMLILSFSAFAEESIQLDNVQMISVGDQDSESPESDGEDASALEQSEDTSSVIEKDPADSNALVNRQKFDHGYAISLPDGWLYYEITDEMAEKGVVYALSCEDGTRQIFIQEWKTDCTDIESLNTLIQEKTVPQSSGVHEFNGTSFVIYDLPSEDVSCAAALMNGKVLNIIFAPQSDSEFMVTAARIMQSFAFTK